jgi:hypothetical protein
VNPTASSPMMKQTANAMIRDRRFWTENFIAINSCCVASSTSLSPTVLILHKHVDKSVRPKLNKAVAQEGEVGYSEDGRLSRN